MRVVALFCVFALTAFVGCDEAIPPTVEEPARIIGFVSPITIPTAEAILFEGDREIARVEFRDGAFALENVAPGTYRVEARAFGYLPNDAATDVVALPGETTDLGRFVMIGDGDLSDDVSRVAGSVADASTGLPVEGASVRATCSAGVCTAQRGVTDASGAFRLPIPAGFETQLTVTAAGYEGKQVVLDATDAGETRDVVVELLPTL